VALQQGSSPYIVYEAPLLVEVGAHEGLAALIVVAADVHTQLQRVQTRDGLDEAQARERISAQLPLSRKLELADYVIWNDDTLEVLQERTRDVHRQVMERFGLE
jgi:dephospho-CoA kinase